MMNDFQKDLLHLRKEIVKNMRAQLMGPGSEISFPDAEHELISEYPSDRYSVGILYPQNQKFGHNEYANDSSEGPEEDEVIVDKKQDETDGEKTFAMYKDDSFDDEVNLAQQNKPSSMGLTFFVSGDLESLNVTVKYAIYKPAQNVDVVIPYPGDSLFIPECLSPYISFDEKTKTIKKLQSIKWGELNDIFEHNGIEDSDLLDLIANINRLFSSGKAYRRYPYEENICLTFDGTMARTELHDVKGYVTAVKHKVTDGVYSITIMLVNDEKIGSGHIYQPQIIVESKNLSGNSFVPYNNFSAGAASDEELSLDMLYRKKIVYGTGHGVAVDWHISDGQGALFTEYTPTYDVPKINLELRRETAKEKAVKDRCLSMKYLSDLDSTSRDEKIADMTAFIECYEAWINGLEDEKDDALFDARYKTIAQKHIELCRESYDRMARGLNILKTDDIAWKAFVLTNRAMFMQRIHGESQKLTHYPDDEKWQEQMAAIDYSAYPEDKCRWRPFQLAFLLMSIRSIVDPSCDERDLVDLIWFPTGGGKTEAYLGLTAFTIFHRRLLDPANGGTAVMMRYTLRLLTSQQFTRAATLICACEKIRRDEERSRFANYNLGTEEITIGLWIGSQHVPNTNADAKENFDKLKASNNNLKYRKDRFNKFQVLKCPWCGTKLVKDEINKKEVGEWGYRFRNNKFFYMSCTQEGCEFERQLPIQVVDEELYKKPPTLLFSTVDKFAMMAWKSSVTNFFGKDGNDAPELIIQDELHLIAGPLGSMVGIYESAIDYLCSQKGKKPKIIASTATIRQAAQQCRALYNREVRQFPAQGLDAADSFFAKEIPVKDDFGRTYLGIMPSGKTKVMLQARATAVALQFVHQLDCPDEEKDQFYTLAIYFNSLRELGKASSVVADDVKDFIKRITFRQIFHKFSSRNIGSPYELTSRVGTSELNDTLDKLENAVYSQQNIADKKYPINVLLASNMISVGVDVSRLNLMFLQGQPKAVSEYIQASSRIGRTNPGLAVTLYDASKSRDRSYYEQFIPFHAAFYKFVEPTGITPFSSPARDRALHAVLLAGARQSDLNLNEDNDAPNVLLEPAENSVEKFAEFLYERVKEINLHNPEGMQDDSDKVKDELSVFIDEWKNKAQQFEDLIYGDRYVMTSAPKGTHRLIKTFDDKTKDDAQRTLTSLRNVDKTVPVSVLVWEDEYE